LQEEGKDQRRRRRRLKYLLAQVERKKVKAGNMAVGLFNPMRFLQSMETWKKEETEV
jgi:hypothetical protein